MANIIKFKISIKNNGCVDKDIVFHSINIINNALILLFHSKRALYFGKLNYFPKWGLNSKNALKSETDLLICQMGVWWEIKLQIYYLLYI